MKTPPPHPLSATQVLDTYFLELRAHLLSIAATLDRVDRTPDAAAHRADPRLAFIHRALDILNADAPNRAEQLQLLYSIPYEPLAS